MPGGSEPGLLEDSARRARGIGADIVVRPPGTSVLSLSGAPMSWKYVDDAGAGSRTWRVATGIIMQPLGNSLTYVGGIDVPTFYRMSGGFTVRGRRPLPQPDDIIIDTYYARQNKVHVGEQDRRLLNQPWNVSGIFEAGMLSHLILPHRRRAGADVEHRQDQPGLSEGRPAGESSRR